MRIGIDASILGPRTRASGIGRYVTRLIDHLPFIDPESTFVLVAPAGQEPPRDLPQTVEWHTLPRMRLGKLSTQAAYLWALPQLARRWQLDAFHAPTVHPRPSWPPVPRRMPCPVVVTIHDLIPLTFYASGPSRLPRTHLAYYRWNLRAATGARAIITVSESERQTIVRELKLRPDDVAAIYNGVDSLAVESDAPREPYVLFVGSLEARKNLAGLVRAYGTAVRRGLARELVAVTTSGSGPSEPVEDAVRRLPTEARLRFIEGRTISDGGLASLYAHAEMFVYPSLADSFGLPPLEAMAAGAPVIASGLPALREVLGDSAVFVEGQDDDALAGAIVKLAADAHERERRGAAGAAWARKYSWESCARATLDVYRRAAGAREIRAGAGAGLATG